MHQSIQRLKFYFFKHGIFCGSLILTLFIFSIIIASCKKEKNEHIEISISKPLAGYQAKFQDSIPIKAEIRSTSTIKSVSVSIIDQNQSPVTDPITFYPGTSDYLLDALYLANNKYASSGNYNIEITATDGSVIARRTVTIYLEAVPLSLEAVYALSATNNQSFSIYRIDSDPITYLHTVPGDFLSSSISSRYSQLYTCGRNTGSLSYFSFDSFTSSFSVYPMNSPGTTTFTSYQFIDEYNFIGLYNGSIKAYDQTGFMRYDTGEDPYFTPEAVLKTGDYVIAELLSTGVLQQKKLAAYFYPSGSRRQLLDIDFDVVSMQELTADEKLIFAIKNGHVMIYKYSIQNNNVNLIKDAGALDLFNVLKISSSEYLLSTRQGIFHYFYNNGSNFNVASFPCYAISYEIVNNQFYCLSAYTIHILNAGTFLENSAVTFSDSIIAVNPLYNK